MSISQNVRNYKPRTFRSTLYIWSVLMVVDGFGTGYIAQLTAENRDAMDEGWVLITDGLRLDEACKLRDAFKDEAYALDEVVS